MGAQLPARWPGGSKHRVECQMVPWIDWTALWPASCSALLGGKRDAITMKRWHTLKMNVRPLREVDVSETVALWHETQEDTYHFLTRENELTLEDCARYFRETIRPGANLWVAEDQGQILGYLAMKGSYLDRLYVKPHAQRKGVGLALLQKAQEVSPTGLELHTHQENTKARKFYEKHGFSVVRFGVSPPPESARDVEYHWRP
jgi:ribosomal protein S18 acetylase RimI-like enzyme